MAIAEAEIKSGIRMTEDELMRLPDDGCLYELVDGFAVGKPWATFRAGVIAANLIGLLGPYARGRGVMTIGNAGFRMKNGNIRVPATSFTRKERLPGGHAPNGFGDLAPDLCVEIIRPAEEGPESQKVGEYFDGGAKQVWHVFPETQQVIVFTSPTETRTLEAEDTLTADGILPGFSCRVSDIFTRE